ncbi:hemerythrin domain-containing protein [Dactylosporangium aurantiacum]|uniref:Hemerythrin domain-containing protein n=1 Tax=Dactylosporangium aurantiacum TaxID=35754 RepID=A0A9Q9MLQ5_9ACTN|nr:hemerythrin domain-containing protein [Dactylosporangium aurantiacum]MDG6107991.1 hemerythrin domain-containing protein [Dactylosporangium aurantiacum]UWZ59230.1 hemerythrin domain-containing protein [Dactylosporangium aurantiacum]
MATHDRAVALSAQLAQAHDALRHQLRDLRAGLRRDLPSHCLAFCAAVTAHHQGEDAGMFAELLRQRPDLSGTVAKLVEDHGMIAWILSRVAELASSPAVDTAAVSGELDGLAAILESHFAFEERAISTALDGGTPDTGWSAMVFRFRDRMS